MKNCKVISIINWKGGVGKTTLTYHLATGLQESEFSKNSFSRILLIDLDPQCNLSISCLEFSEFEKLVFQNEIKIHTIKDIFKEFLSKNTPTIDMNDYILKRSVRSSPNHIYKFIDLIPSHPYLIYTDMHIANFDRDKNYVFDDNSLVINENAKVSNEYKFKMVFNMINMIKQDYDYIFIDCPPNLNFITQNAIYASDYYIVPTILDRLSSYGIISIRNAINKLNDEFGKFEGSYNNTEFLGVVANNVREYGGQPKESQSNVQLEIAASIENKMFKSYITNGDGIAKASALAYPVFYLEDWNQNAKKQSAQIKKIIRELLQTIGE